MATIKEELQHLNELRAKLGMDPLKSWKQSMDKLMAKQNELRLQIGDKVHMGIADVINEEANSPIGKAADKKAAKAVAAKKSKGITKANAIRPLILESYDPRDDDAEKRAKNLAIFKAVNEQHPGLIPDEKKWYVAWYRSEMKRKGQLPKDE